MPETKMTQEAAKRSNSANDKAGKDTGKGSFPAIANSAAANNANAAQASGNNAGQKK